MKHRSKLHSTILHCFLAILLTGCGALYGNDGSPAAVRTPAAAGESGAAGGQSRAEVFINRKAVQCEHEGMPLSETESLLKSNGIPVHESACGILTGVAYPAVCGGGTGDVNIHTIPAGQVERAVRLGFRRISVLDNDTGIGIKRQPCR